MLSQEIQRGERRQMIYGRSTLALTDQTVCNCQRCGHHSLILKFKMTKKRAKPFKPMILPHLKLVVEQCRRVPYLKRRKRLINQINHRKNISHQHKYSMLFSRKMNKAEPFSPEKASLSCTHLTRTHYASLMRFIAS